MGRPYAVAEPAALRAQQVDPELHPPMVEPGGPDEEPAQLVLADPGVVHQAGAAVDEPFALAAGGQPQAAVHRRHRHALVGLQLLGQRLDKAGGALERDVERPDHHPEPRRPPEEVLVVAQPAPRPGT